MKNTENTDIWMLEAVFDGLGAPLCKRISADKELSIALDREHELVRVCVDPLGLNDVRTISEVLAELELEHFGGTDLFGMLPDLGDCVVDIYVRDEELEGQYALFANEAEDDAE